MSENRLLPTRGPFPGMSVSDLMLIEWPHFTEDDRHYFLWEVTGWPSFFAGENWPVHTLQQQMREFREGRYTPDV